MIETLNSNRFGKLVNSNIESTVKYSDYHRYKIVDGPVYKYIPDHSIQIMTVTLDYPNYNLVFSKEITYREYGILWAPYVMNYDIYYNPNDIKFIDSESISIISQYSVTGLKIFNFEFNLTKFVRNKNEKNLF
jgi:hypothetical protein